MPREKGQKEEDEEEEEEEEVGFEFVKDYKFNIVHYVSLSAQTGINRYRSNTESFLPIPLPSPCPVRAHHGVMEE